jgi:hypothetical protein
MVLWRWSVEVFRDWGADMFGVYVREVLSQCGLDLAQAFQGALATLLLLPSRQGGRWGRVGAGWGWRPQAHATDLEVFLEAVGLEEVGEFERADIAALSTDLTLKVEDNGAQILEGVAQAQQLIPHSFPVKG